MIDESVQSTPATRLDAADAERAVLGAALIEGASFERIEEIVVEADFAIRAHREVFSAMKRVPRPFDVVAVREELRQRGVLDDVGGLKYLGDLMDEVPSAVQAELHARAVKEASLRRSLARIASTAVAAFQSDATAAEAIRDRFVSELMALDDRAARGALRTIGQVAPDAIEAMRREFESEGGLTGLSTGFAGLDRLLGGWQPRTLSLIAARPSVGKSTLALNTALHVARNLGRPVLFISMEMSAVELTKKGLDCAAQVSATRRRWQLTTEVEFTRLWDAVDASKEWPFIFDDSGEATVLQLKRRMRRATAMKGKLGLVVVDYLQLLTSESGETRTEQVSAISRGLKRLAVEFDVPIIALSQLNRSPMGRTGGRPQLGDLRESGALEQDADVVVLLHRNELDGGASKEIQQIEAHVAKNRTGAVGHVLLELHAAESRFVGVGA